MNGTNGSGFYVSGVIRFSVGTVSALSCLLAITTLFCCKLHRFFNYRLIIYWLTANVLVPLVHVVSLPVAWYGPEMNQFCLAIAALVVYSEWVLIIISLFIALVMVAMAVCYVQLKILEIPGVLTSVLLPLSFFWVPLLTGTYGYNRYQECWIIEWDKNYNHSQTGYTEKLVLMYIPVLAQILFICVAFVTVILTLALRWCKEKVSCNSDEMEPLLSSHSNHYTALKEMVILFGCPVMVLAMVVIPITVVAFVTSIHVVWIHVVLSTTPGISGIVAASSVGIHLFVLHKKKGRVVGTCEWCWNRNNPVQLISSCVDEDMIYGATTNSYPTKFESPTESEVDSALASVHHQA